jgi:hypothetical protein
MCLIVAYIAICVFGVIAVVKGKFTLSRGKVCEGISARIVGILLILTPVFAFAASFVYGIIVGVGMVQAGTTELTKERQSEIQFTSIVISLGILIAMFVVAMTVAFMTAKPAKRKPLPPDELLDEPNP